MSLMHQFLLEKTEWYETCLQRRAQELGYGYIKPSLVQFIKNMSADGPSRIALLAERLGVTRRRVSQIAAEGAELGLLELVEDADDKRVMLVQLSERGEIMVDAAVLSMTRIENELARRIGRANLDKLKEVLAMDWGPAEVRDAASPEAPRPARVRAKSR
jgi:DNA-binding MarR family transcriptional regulator